MDKIIIRDLRIETIVGIWEWERKMLQTVCLDIDIAADIAAAAVAGNIESTVDYKAVSRRVTDLVQTQQYELLEALVEGVAGVILDEFGAPWVRVTACKPRAVKNTGTVGVVIERGSLPD
jgi:dihydroneopterin aldolase